jgi:hypothetical protein
MKTLSSHVPSPRRVLGLLALVLGTQALTACVVVPEPPPRGYGPRAGVVVEVGPSYQPRPYYRHHHHREYRDNRDNRDYRDRRGR